MRQKDLDAIERAISALNYAAHKAEQRQAPTADDARNYGAARDGLVTISLRLDAAGDAGDAENAKAWPLGPCTLCHGSGWVEPTRPEDAGMQTCPRCNGEGGEIVPIYDPEELIV